MKLSCVFLILPALALAADVETVEYKWRDATRDRDVPAKIYYPAHADAPCPVIIFSHGLGGTRDGYEYLGRHWAAHGYVSVHLQHLGSDNAVWRDSDDKLQAMRRAAADPRNAINRPRDVSFAIDQLAKSPLKDRLDFARIGVAGHSFGAYTALAVAGEVPALSDPRVKAALPMSAPVPGKRDPAKTFAGIHIPCLHMTGTKDESLINDTKAANRRIPFDNIHGVDQYLVIFQDGNHMIFARPSIFEDEIKKSSTAFWDAYLRGDAKAKTWLREEFPRELGKHGTFEKK